MFESELINLASSEKGLSNEFLIGLSSLLDTAINRRVKAEIALNEQEMKNEIKELKEKLAALEQKKAQKYGGKSQIGAGSNKFTSKIPGKSSGSQNHESDSQSSKKQEKGASGNNSRPKVWSKNVSSQGAADNTNTPSIPPKHSKISTKDPQSATSGKKSSLNSGVKPTQQNSFKYAVKKTNGSSAAAPQESPKTVAEAAQPQVAVSDASKADQI